MRVYRKRLGKSCVEVKVLWWWMGTEWMWLLPLYEAWGNEDRPGWSKWVSGKCWNVWGYDRSVYAWWVLVPWLKIGRWIYWGMVRLEGKFLMGYADLMGLERWEYEGKLISSVRRMVWYGEGIKHRNLT
jgi:hypothetical protein